MFSLVTVLSAALKDCGNRANFRTALCHSVWHFDASLSAWTAWPFTISSAMTGVSTALVHVSSLNVVVKAPGLPGRRHLFQHCSTCPEISPLHPLMALALPSAAWKTLHRRAQRQVLTGAQVRQIGRCKSRQIIRSQVTQQGRCSATSGDPGTCRNAEGTATLK